MSETHHYFTLFDHRYLARAVALYRSLERFDENFILRAVCLDDDSRRLLRRLRAPSLQITAIDEVERADPALRAVRSTRTSWEYCWTSTSAVCRYFLDSEPGIGLLTYLDADLHFSSNPTPLFAELDASSILLIPHRALPETEAVVGVYNVGWITFRSDARGRAALEWWRERCLEWCYDRFEPGRFGDQKYLDDWPSRFEGVRVSQLPSAGLACWNEDRHHIVAPADGEPPTVDGSPLLYFHHSGLRLHRATAVARRSLPRSERLRLVRGPVDVLFGLAGEPQSEAVEAIWRDYVAALSAALGELAAAGGPHDLFLPRPSRRLIGRQLARRLLPV
jgi:hypothetical protein